MSTTRRKLHHRAQRYHWQLFCDNFASLRYRRMPTHGTLSVTRTPPLSRLGLSITIYPPLVRSSNTWHYVRRCVSCMDRRPGRAIGGTAYSRKKSGHRLAGRFAIKVHRAIIDRWGLRRCLQGLHRSRFTARSSSSGDPPGTPWPPGGQLFPIIHSHVPAQEREVSVDGLPKPLCV